MRCIIWLMKKYPAIVDSRVCITYIYIYILYGYSFSLSLSLSLYIYTYLYICTCIHIYIHIYIYIIHTHQCPWRFMGHSVFSGVYPVLLCVCAYMYMIPKTKEVSFCSNTFCWCVLKGTLKNNNPPYLYIKKKKKKRGGHARANIERAQRRVVSAASRVPGAAKSKSPPRIEARCAFHLLFAPPGKKK